MNRQDFQSAVDSLPFGKVLPGARYIYLPAESPIDSPLGPFLAKLRERLAVSSSHHVVKLAHADYAISFLDYPDFLSVAHPELKEAIRIQLATGSVKSIDFSSHANPPILHRFRCPSSEFVFWTVLDTSLSNPPRPRAGKMCAASHGNWDTLAPDQWWDAGCTPPCAAP